MTNGIDIVKRMDQAFKEKDKETFRSLLHEDYKFRGPMMGFDNAEQATAFVEDCPFEFHNENESYVAENGSIARTFDWVVTAPFQATIRMSEHLSVVDGKVKSAELFYDTAKFPQEATAAMGG